MNVREKYLARWVLSRWHWRVWSKRTQCNIDLIEMAPINEKDAFLLTDTTNRTVYRFHIRDVFRNLMANLGSYSQTEMLPTPRAPCNPYTNAPLTLAQTITVCQELRRQQQRQPLLLAAFCAARFDIRRFYLDNSILLANHTIHEFFKEITDYNRPVLFETLIYLLTQAERSFTPRAISVWLSERPVTRLHDEWRILVRDFTLFTNVFVYSRWMTVDQMMEDVCALYDRSFTIKTSAATDASENLPAFIVLLPGPNLGTFV